MDAPARTPPSPHLSLEAIRSRKVHAIVPPSTFAGFLGAIVAVIVIALVSFRALQARSESAQRVTHTLTVVSNLQRLLFLLQDAETGQRGYLLTGNDAYLAPFLAAKATLPGVFGNVRALVADNVEQTRRLALAQRVGDEKLGELDRTIELRRSGRLDAALELVNRDEGRLLMDRGRDAIAEMMRAEQTELDVRNRQWAQASAVTAWVTWGGSALLLVLIVAALGLSSRDFRAQAVQGWLRLGQADLSIALRGELDLRELGDRVARFLARYLDAPVAAVHVAGSTGVLSRVGAFGLAPSQGPEPFGLTQEAFAENRLLRVRDVPAGYFEVSSGVGRAASSELVLAPATAEGRANGVMELGFFRKLIEPELELLERVSEVVGIAFRSAEYRKNQLRMLEETQRLAGELQTQQEELRVSNEELEQQTRTLQRSQERLTNQQAELEEINAQLEEHTQSLERQRQDLTRAQVELERASAYKSEFLANMSHELRTPLNSSLILAKLLMDNRAGNLTPEQVKFAQTIYSAGNDLLVLINDILDLSRIEAGKLDVRPEYVTVSRLAEELGNTFVPVAREKALEFAVRVEPGVPRELHSDPTRLQQILRNLLSNALKFTDRGGVFLDVRPGGENEVLFVVRDTGIGIARNQQAVIFEAFRQADGTSNRKYGGAGLGLSISRDLACLLGGEIEVESAAGRGSTFTLRLPVAYSALPGAPVLPKREHRTTRSSPPSRPPVAAAAAIPDDRDGLTRGERSILVVEDDPAFARILLDLGRELEFKVLVADTGEQGLALAAQYRPSAIVLDVGLPDRSGLSVLDALKHSPATRHIPVHMLSVDDFSQTALEMGALGYALKPVQREQLIDTFRRLEAKFTQKLRRVLVVEDDAAHREGTCRLLAGDGVEAVGTGTAAEALAALASSSFDCVVLDLTLPDRSGFELLEEMTQSGPPPPVIVYTGQSLSRDEEQSLRRFSSSIIIKGARSPERLLDEVTLFLHQVEADLPPDRQRMLMSARQRDAVFEGRRVLIVEDDVRNIFALSSVLEPLGARVEIARNGREALDHLERKPGVDLVLMDVMMPEMDGLEAMREARKRPELRKLPIIALTAKAMADDRDNCLDAGANDYIAKPLDVDKLLSLARVWMPK